MAAKNKNNKEHFTNIVWQRCSVGSAWRLLQNIKWPTNQPSKFNYSKYNLIDSLVFVVYLPFCDLFCFIRLLLFRLAVMFGCSFLLCASLIWLFSALLVALCLPDRSLFVTLGDCFCLPFLPVAEFLIVFFLLVICGSRKCGRACSRTVACVLPMCESDEIMQNAEYAYDSCMAMPNGAQIT